MNMKRMRGRNHRPNGSGGGGGGFSRNQQNGIPLNRNHVFDSSGPEMRVRGTAQQLYEKYQQLARDAAGNGDRVLGEAYYQHAEHYFRIISAINQAQGQPNVQQGQLGSQPQNGQERGNFQPQQNGNYQERTDYPRRDYMRTDEPQPEAQPEQRTDAQPREQYREQPRRFEQRPYEPRPKPEFQRSDRNHEQRPQYRPETVPDTRIDISSALEAELAAATAGLGEQPALPALEARAIPIIPDAPPTHEPVAETPKPARSRGRPRTIKVPEKSAE